MCLSSIYCSKGDSQAILRNVQSFSVEPGGIRFTDILEQETLLRASLVSADLVNGRVIINLEG